ncbi:MAG: capsule assembly Wzi family protein [Cyclobacteriaceae bacterium]
MKKYLFSLLIFTSALLPGKTAKAQAWNDSLRLEVESFALAAQEDYQPLWLLANRWGLVSDRASSLSILAGLHNGHVLGKQQLALKYGGSVLADDQGTLIFPEYYFGVMTKKWELQAGRWQQATGMLPHDLSSGALGMSQNALPIPQVRLGSRDFISYDFMPEWLRFRLHVAHGWMGNERIVNNTWLHEKSFYLKAEQKQFSFWAGLTHYVMWGGEHPEGSLPDRFIDFIRISTGFPQGMGEDSVFTGPGDTAGALGNHIGVTDLGFSWKMQKYTFSMSTQTLFEKGRDATRNTRGEIRAFNLLGPDRLVNFTLETPHAWWQKGVVEFINTTYQGGTEIFVGRDHFYDNAIYTDGWNYQGNVIGNPLLLNRQRVENYFGEDAQLGSWNMVNNRVAGLHTAAKGRFSPKLSYQLRLTYTRNFGNYVNTELFTPAIQQWYSLLETEYHFNRQLSLAAATAYDFGDFGNNLGGMLRLRWKWAQQDQYVRFPGYQKGGRKNYRRP